MSTKIKKQQSSKEVFLKKETCHIKRSENLNLLLLLRLVSLF